MIITPKGCPPFGVMIKKGNFHIALFRLKNAIVYAMV